MRNLLPKIFSAARLKIPASELPSVVFVMTPGNVDQAGDLIKTYSPSLPPIETFGNWWIETDVFALSVIYEPSAHAQITIWWRQPLGKKGRTFKIALPVSDLTFHEFSDDKNSLFIKFYFYACIVVAHYATELRKETYNKGAKRYPSFFQRQSDTLRYSTLSDLGKSVLHTLKQPSEMPSERSSIRMREHDVRGYTRTLPSGRVVPVRPYRRGDPALGRATRVIK